MERTTKGAIAIGAGALLLLGGAGTYALWEDTLSVADEGTIRSGDLDLELGTAAWTLNGAAVADITAVQIVPGDVLSLTQPLTVTAVGDNLEATLTVSDAAALTGDTDLAAALDVVAALDAGATWATPAGAPNTFDVAPSPTDEPYATVPATVTITFDPTTPDQVATAEAVDLSSLTFTLEQQL